MVHNNPDLQTLDMGITTSWKFNVTKNGHKTQVAFPRLEVLGVLDSAGGGFFSDLPVISLPALVRTVNSSASLSFINNTIQGLSLPRLSSANGTFTLYSNSLLFDVGLPSSQHIYDELIITDDPRLHNFTANVLKKVRSVRMSGAFTNVESFSLEEVSGDFSLIGDTSMDCSWFDDHFPRKVVKGLYTCIGKHTHPPTPRRPSTSTSLPESSNQEVESGGLLTAAKAGIGVGAAVGGVALMGLGVWVFLRIRQRKEDPGTAGPLQVGKPELEGVGKPGIVKIDAEVDGRGVDIGELPTSTSEEATPRSELAVSRPKGKEAIELP